MKRTAFLSSVSFAICLVLLLFVLFGIRWFLPEAGRTFDPEDTNDFSALVDICESLSPAIRALEDLRANGRQIPGRLSEVSTISPKLLEEYPELAVTSREGSYKLYFKLGWDPFLVYEATEQWWVYDPGDGGARTRILPVSTEMLRSDPTPSEAP
ncbi:MAG: hypothetical protein AAF236_10405 [Verrucomicrobiota bacterium]